MKKLYVSPFSSRTLVETESSILAASGQAVQAIVVNQVKVHDFAEIDQDIDFGENIFN